MFQFKELSGGDDFQARGQSLGHGGIHHEEILVAGDQEVRHDLGTQGEICIVFRVPADHHLT